MNNYNCSSTQSDTTVTFTIDSNKTILDDEISMYNENDEVDVVIVDKLVKEFNRVSNGLIQDYNYQVIDKKNIHIEILFKHVFSKFGEIQRYINYKLTYNEQAKSLEIVLNNGNIGLSNIRNCQQFPFDKLQLSNTKMADGMNKTIIVAYSNAPISTYKNYKMIVDYAKRLIYDNYVNIENYVAITKNK